MLKFDLKNRFKIENKGNDSNQLKENHDKDTESEKAKEEYLKDGTIASILKGSISGEEDKTVTFADLNSVEEELEAKTEKTLERKIEETLEAKPEETLESKIEKTLEAKIEAKLISKLEEKLGSKVKTELIQDKMLDKQEFKKSVKSVSPESEKISKLISVIESSREKMIVPLISMDQGTISYPILTQIGEDDDNFDFLEKLASPNFDILERSVYERLVVCPDHPGSMSTSVRINCPHCSSIDILKLHLIEHKRCGYISENKNFEISEDGTITHCPSCKKQIHDANKEIARPAMWYSCNGCNEKFDDVSVKLHCRKFNHDFEISNAHSILIPGFKIKNYADTSNASISPILNQLKKLLGSFGFSAEENHTVIGKSGNHYRINIYGEDEHKRTTFIFIKNPNAESDNSELNSKIIEVLDTSPTVTILIGFPSISEKAKTITSNYNISIITEKEPNKILSSIKDILSNKVPKLED